MLIQQVAWVNKFVLDCLKEYSTEVNPINKLLVSAFLRLKSITTVKNLYIQSLMITDDSSDEWNVLEKFTTLLNDQAQKICFEELLELFEFVISPSDKLINGAIYTPKNIREYITKQSFLTLGNNIHDIKVVDIACGCGGFLINASRILKQKTEKSYKQIFERNIFGVDIQTYSVKRTEILLSLLAITEGEDEEKFNFNLYQGNSLEFNWQEHNAQIKKNKGFDLILGNPPYVYLRNMDARTKELIKKWSVCSTGHPDLYIPFFQIGYELLNKNGVLGFITVNTFVHSANGRALRKYFTKNNISLKIIDFKDEQIFKSRTTYTCLCFLQKKESDYISYITLKQKKLVDIHTIKFNKILYKDADCVAGWSVRNYDFITKMESVGVRFGDIYNTNSGIATLSNKVYIFKPDKEKGDYLYMQDGTKIEKKICKNIVNSNRINQENNIENLKEKIIFPYIYNKNNEAILIKEKYFSDNFPSAYKHLSKHKCDLGLRDKGNGKYPAWYAFGRTQSLGIIKCKLLFPRMVKKGFVAEISNDPNLYFYNGMSAYLKGEGNLQELKKLLTSETTWQYIENKCKYYASGYFGLGKNYLDNLGCLDHSK
jgi:methylase of polypeptide subunit release factors